MKFGSAGDALSVNVVNDNTLTCLTPPGEDGLTVEVTGASNKRGVEREFELNMMSLPNLADLHELHRAVRNMHVLFTFGSDGQE